MYKQKRSIYTSFFKPIGDRVVALLLLVCLAPFIGLISILVKIGMGSPIIFTQSRGGYQNKPFGFYKFRTMTNNTDDEGKLLPDEKRLTPFGQFLRKTSMDELPQLLNIIKGDMSFIGPRPLLADYLIRYTDEQRLRHDVKPGITGLAQVSGRNSLDWEERFKLDLTYVQTVSFWTDCVILMKTIGKVVFPTDINNPDNATMSEFMGTKQEEQ